jgi:hypothetical protein
MQSTAQSNISDFNDYVRNQMVALSARRETTHDLVNNLFKAYARTDCEEFRDFIKDARRNWERNRWAYNPEILMNECQDEYNRLLLLRRWGARTEQEEQIITLRAEIEHLKASCVKPPKSPKLPGKQGDKFTWKWKWKESPPKEGEPIKKEFEGKTYHWCPGHKFWTMHLPHECTVLHPEKKAPTNTPKKSGSPPKKLTFAKAAIAAMEAGDRDESEAGSENQE